MNDLTLLICDREEEYLRLMTEYVLKQQGLRWQVRAYTDPEEMKRREAGRKEEKGDILLFSENVLQGQPPAQIAECTVLLSEKGKITEGDTPGIYKYQGADEVLRELLELYAAVSHSAETILSKGGKSRILTFYSPVHRCLQTTLALALASKLCEKGRTLYLNFEYHGSVAGMLPDDKTRDLADLVYFLNAQGEKFRIRLNSIVRKYGNLEYVPPMKVGANLPAVSAEEWLRLLRRLDEEGGYEYLVLDLSESVQGLPEFLSQSSKVYTICKKDRISEQKLELYRAQLERKGYGDIWKRTEKVYLPFIRSLPEGNTEYIKGELAMFVKELLDEGMKD